MNDYVKTKIKEALAMFIKKDRTDLLKTDIYEPTISHRIAIYLERLFPNYNVDCEYNKHLLDKKKNIVGAKIRPDVIIHKRLSDDANRVIFEIKKSGAGSKLARADVQKLNGCLQNTLNYSLGVFVGVLKRRIDIVWIEKENGNFKETREVL
ncbi:MAG: hypothetical protein PHG46_03175 [Candidatus Omnitrophica bacterium]|jgi:hypothetical protein|nr:hypothetical protein [Candidatus Omnitrophota bacterium]